MHRRGPLRSVIFGLLLLSAVFVGRTSATAATASAQAPILASASMDLPTGDAPGPHHDRHKHVKIPLTRTFNNPGHRATRSQAFWTIGYPFQDGEIPPGKVIAGCVLGKQRVPCSLIARKLAADGSVEWGQLLVDFSGAPIAGGGNAELTLTAGSGSWNPSTTRTNADWEALGDRVKLTNLTTTGVAGVETSGDGTWIAKFNGGSTDKVEIYGSSPQGLFVEVTAEFTSAGAVNSNLTAVMDYWVTEDATGGEGPIESWGPFIRNTLLHPSDPSISTLGSYSYDAAFTRSGATVRSYNGVTTPALAIGAMMRPDAQGDWTAHDPGIYVTQDYTQAVATRKLPPFAPGVTYTGGNFPQPYANMEGLSGAVISVDRDTSVFGNINDDNAGWHPSAVQFAGTQLPGGLNASTVYWAVHEGNNTLSLYDTLDDALANGTTGLITPTSPGTAVTIWIAEAPGTTGQYNLVLADTGARPDISLLGEWFSGGYLVGNTQPWQRLGRVMAYDEASNPIFGIDGETGRIMSFMDAPNTPHGMVSYPNDFYADGNFSSDINGGAVPNGGTGGWDYSGSSVAHMPNGVYGVWLMEGGPFLRDLLLGIGDSVLAVTSGLPGRNIVIGTTTYYGSISCVWGGDQARVGAWHTRDVVEAAMAAKQGSPEETYFRNVLTENMNECVAYQNYKPATYRAIGLIFYDEANKPPASNTMGVQEVEGFMQSYMDTVLGWGELLEGDYVPGLATEANFVSQWLEYFYGGGGCPYYATAYALGPGLSNYGDPSPGAYVSSFSDLGVNGGAGAVADFTTGSTTVTITTTLPWTLAAGDIFRPTNYDTSGSSAIETTAPPSPFVGATDYYIESPNQGAATFQLSATNPGTAITAAATTTGVNGFFLPTGQTVCPSTGTLVGNTSSPDISLMYEIASLAVLAEVGVSGADAAYSTAVSRFTGSCSTDMQWCLAPP